MVGSCVDGGQMWIQIQVGTKVLSHDTASFQNLKTMTFSFKFSRLTIRLSNIDVEHPPKKQLIFPAKPAYPHQPASIVIYSSSTGETTFTGFSLFMDRALLITEEINGAMAVESKV